MRELNGKWKLVRLLGAGGTSNVYEAVHRNGRRAALKLLAASDREQAQMQATAESRIANTITHPGAVEVLDDDVAEDGTPYIVMELLDGHTLDTCLPLAEALPIFESMLEVLAAFHEQGIVHRDLKPENVFVLKSGGVKLIDLGLAAHTGDQEESASWFGTPGFMPPEQARAEWSKVDARSDIWAIAATFYTVLTGRMVHERDTQHELVKASAREEVSLDASGLPLALLDVLHRALAFDREDRFADAHSMLRALRRSMRVVATPGRNDSLTRVFRLDLVA